MRRIKDEVWRQGAARTKKPELINIAQDLYEDVIDMLAKRIDDAEKILSEVSYAQAMSAAYVMNQNYRKNKLRARR